MATSPLPRNSAAQAWRDQARGTRAAPPGPPAVVLQREELDRCGWGHMLPTRHARPVTEASAEREV